jgi:nucleoside-diphosphate-sugar epimerase
LVRAVRARGWAAISAGRRRPADLPADVLWREYDLQWTTLPDGFFDGVDTVVHGAMTRGDVDVNVAAGKLLLEQAQWHGIARVVFLSSLAAHEGALSAYGRQKHALEQLFAQYGALVVRPGLVLGNGGAFGAMCEYLRGHRFVPLIGGGAQPIQTVYVGDLIEAICDAIARDVRGVYTVAEAEPVSYRAFYETLGERMGVRPAFVPVPFWAADLAVRLAELLHVNLPIDRDNLLGLKTMQVDRRPRLDPEAHPVASYETNIASALRDAASETPL